MLVGSNNILYRKIKGKEDKQVVLPSRLKPLVYKELHVNMGHLEYERALELIRERFYWPQMNDEVKHFVGKVCKRVKDKRPVRLPQAPQKSITFSTPMELVGLDFLHLDICVGRFKYLLVITGHFTWYTQVYPTVIKKPKPQQISYLTTTSCDSECQGKSSMIKVVTLRTSYSSSCLNYATSKDIAPRHTIPSAMGRRNE